MRPQLIALTVLASSAALAQGVPDPRTAIDYPNAQSAAVEDATAIVINPAGLAMMEGLEVNLGGFVRSNGRIGQTDGDATIALAPGGGFGLGLGSGITFADGTLPRLRTSGALAIGADKTASLGVAVHALTDLGGGGRADWQWDLGTQIRPARWLAFGAVVEQIGANQSPATARLGLSLRPLDELLTVGLDARLVPGSRNIASSDYAKLSFIPGLAARLDLGGLAFTAGANITNFGVVNAGPPALEALVGLEVNGDHLGLDLLGGVSGILAGTYGGAGGARIRASTADYPSLFPDRGRWLTMTLTGDGVPVDQGKGLLHDIFAEKPQSIAILTSLKNLADDPSVDGFVLRIKGMGLGWGRLAELREALAAMKAKGKKIIVHMDAGDDADVFLASVADRVYLTPAGGLELNGLRAEMTYFGDTLEKIGIEAEAVSAGRYKSAPRTFTADEPNPEELEVENAILDGAFGTLTGMIAKGRNLTVDQVKSIIDRGGLTAKDALDAKIVDELAYEDELEKKVAGFAGHPVHLEEHFLEHDERDVRWDEPPRIALIPITGEIAGGHGGGGLFSGKTSGADDVIEAIDRAASDGDVKAIVLRIDSPGGDALASDLIWHAVMEARAKKPVVCSMGDVAASGGYYIASAAQTIYAEPNTITGSIGVFGLMFNVERLADNWGVRSYEVQRGALPGPTLLRPMSDAERAAIQASVSSTYERFLDQVTAGRGDVSGLKKDDLRKIAEGHVWTGAQAKDNKLIDHLGGLSDALADAKKRAGLSESEDVSLDVITGHEDDLLKMTGLASVLAKGSDAEAVKLAAKLLLGDPDALAFALQSEGKPLAMSPVSIRVR